MNRFSIIFSLLILISIDSIGQESNGRVNSLVAAENFFSAFTKRNGSKAAFLKVSDDESIIFRPDPVKVKNFYGRGTMDGPGELSWVPVYAKISQSGDWGFTTGPYSFLSGPNAEPSYGQYLSVWKTDFKGVWKLALNLNISHQKALIEPELNFTDPKNIKFYEQNSLARLRQRQEIITTTDRLFSNTLMKDQALAHDVFMAEDARFLFPGEEPIIGKARINNFVGKNQISIESEPLRADRAQGSDLAYSYGIAYITRNKIITKYHYVRIWESQEEHKWNVILEIYTPASN
ncbi:MAG: hypothetical protein Q8S11_03025 [Daejeonella sp.]|uniref:hypothetical protein n=1 Tax=Daejeonella sp. TaxID=2805397 RepID=UPI002733A18F|nr:hypothetical protein [Daejeonella sp.]MDP3467279.1 hypothetical protein [Daejeonella sp.]